MKFAITRQHDGSYVLHFEAPSIRTEIALTEQDYDVLILELQKAYSH